MDQLEVEASVVASQFEHVERALTVVACLGCKRAVRDVALRWPLPVRSGRRDCPYLFK